jgi:putative FmdB family regulatory protein
MPTYEYRCPEGHDFERFFRSISAAEPQVACPVCGKVAERRMSAGAGLLFKGSGFYLTDYGKNAHRTSGSAPKSEGGASSSSESGSSSSSTSGSSDSKPAAKPEAKPASTPAPKSDK